VPPRGADSKPAEKIVGLICRSLSRCYASGRLCSGRPEASQRVVFSWHRRRGRFWSDRCVRSTR